MGAILLKQAVLGHGSRPVLCEVNLHIPGGDFLLIGGPNGGGKSTLLRSILGLLPLLAGVREVQGVRFGYVPQQANSETLLPVTALEMVALGASASQPFWRPFGRMERAFHMECLSRCRADQFARHPFATLSGGQRQRVLLARALATRPNVLILDEPTAGIDPETQEIIAQLLQSQNRQEGVSIILVSHEPEIFARSASRLLRVALQRIEETESAPALTHEGRG